MMNPYAANKALLHPQRLLKLKAGEQPSPIHLQLIVSDRCNCDCSFCAYRSAGYPSNELFSDGRKNPNRFLPTPKALEILSDAALLGVRAVQFTGGGEPTLHRDLPTLLRVAHMLGMDVALVTNGILLHGEIAEALLEGASWVRVSLDAGTADTYAAVKGVSPLSFNRVLGNVRHLVDRRGSATSPYIGISFVVTENNWQEILEAQDAAILAGADNIRYTAAFTIRGRAYFDEFADKVLALIAEATTNSHGRILVSDSFSERLHDLEQGPPNYDRCPYQHLVTYIGADQNLYRCCVLAYNRRGLVGSLAGRRFAELWRSEGKEVDFAAFNARGCTLCQFNRRNREILSLIEAVSPTHGNFV